MTLPDRNVPYEVVCPHCHKTFEAEALVGRAGRYTGFKCPHCRLFVAVDSGAGQAATG